MVAPVDVNVIPVLVAFVAVVAVVALVAVAELPPIDKLDAVPVRPVPAPENEVADKTPVLGTKLNFVDAVFCGKFPVVAVTQVG